MMSVKSWTPAGSMRQRLAAIRRASRLRDYEAEKARIARTAPTAEEYERRVVAAARRIGV